jgi:hypothetical protein
MWKTKPRADRSLDRGQLRSRQPSNRSQQLRVGNGHEVLRVEGSSSEKRNRNACLERCSARACRVRDQRGERTVGIGCGYAQYKRWAYLGRHAEIHQPHLASTWRRHCSSRRSSSTNSRSAAATKSSLSGRPWGASAARRSNSDSTSARSCSGSWSNSSSSFLALCVMT